jgi:hypothetical protein
LNAFKTDVKRALTSWGFIAGIAGMAVAAFFGVFERMLPIFQGKMAEGLAQGFTMELTMNALASNVVLLVLPILCALPYTPAFVDDFKSRFLHGCLPRSGRQPYVGGKVLTTALSGGLTLLLGALLILAVFAILFLPLEIPPEQPELSDYERQMQMHTGGGEEAAGLAAQINLGALLEKCLAFFLSGCLWSLAGGLLAAVTMSKYMAYASPFILYYVLVMLGTRYFKGVYVLNPQEWVNPLGDWVWGGWGACLLAGEIAVILAFAYAAVIRGKIKEL